ncbi:MAG: dethiobiotin synthase [Sterolibacteriaceae bacterium MAG5]|nr:dethiobiotin synthase [Candidatus Nitricoxidireducens bremensis]
MGNAYFITATGTDSGKTFVAEGLARELRARGRRLRALKPVMSGYDETRPADSDAGRLLAACGIEATPAAVADIAPWRFAAPLSPDRAAALEGRVIDFDGLMRWCRDETARNEDLLLIEGIGGVMVPLDGQRTVLDWMAALQLPVLLVAGTYLGAISHALTALAALRSAGLAPVAIVLNESAGGIPLADTLVSLAPHAGGIPLLPAVRGGDGLAALADFLLKDGR